MENTDKFPGSSETPVQPLRPPSYDPETAQADAEAAARAAEIRQPDPPATDGLSAGAPQATPTPTPSPVAETQAAAKPVAAPEPKRAVDALSSAQAAGQTERRLAAARVAAKPMPTSGPGDAQPKVERKRSPQPIGKPKATAAPAAATAAAATPATSDSERIPKAASPSTSAEAKKVAPIETGTAKLTSPATPKASAASSAVPAVASGAATQSRVVTSEEAEPSGQPSSLRADEVRLLQTRGLVKVYDGRAVVKEVDIHVRPTEIVGLLGPNGAGKTTTFYMIVGLVPPNGGRVFFNDEDVTDDPMYRRARKGMGYLPQEESIFRKLTVEQNIMAVMETLKISRSERRDRCHALMKQFGIEHIGKSLALTCSGGEKRRLTIARSLVTQPKLLMLDEPFSGVDPIAVSEIQDIIVGLREAGLAILITDHNVRETLNIVDRACLICEGKVLREGTRDFLINDPISRELYLGDRFSM